MNLKQQFRIGSVLPKIRRCIAAVLASNRFTRVLFKRLALDEDMLSLILSDPLCAARVGGSRRLAERIAWLAALNPISGMLGRPGAATCPPTESTTSPRDPITDISLGINWGPCAFPLGRHAYYFRVNTGHLTERWLRRLSSDACVVLLADAEVMEAAQALQSRYRQVKALFAFQALPKPENPDSGNARGPLTAFKGLDAVVVPLTVAHREIEFIPGNMMPDLAPEYGVFRDLWRMGFRQFANYGFAGLRQMEIPFLLDRFKDRHKGRRCFVAGNGPSLNQLDMGLLKDEITFGANRCYLGFEQWGFAFNYWACIDRLQIEEYGLEYQDTLPRETVKFLPFEYLTLVQFPNCCPVNFDYEGRPPYRFSGTPDVLHLGFTVTHALLQIAVVMGCNPIYLIGVDHRYNLNEKTTQNRVFGKKMAKIWVTEDSSKPTHFTDKYTQGEKPKLFVTPKPEKAEACFGVARQWTEKNNIEIINVTPGSDLKIFKTDDFFRLFE